MARSRTVDGPYYLRCTGNGAGYGGRLGAVWTHWTYLHQQSRHQGRRRGPVWEGTHLRSELRSPHAGPTLLVAVNLDEDLNADSPQVPKQFRSYFVTPAARFHIFSNAAISPWVSLGGGLGHFSESSNLTNRGKTGTTTGVFQAGVGMDVKPFKNVGFRLETRDFWSGVPQLNVNTGKSRQHNIFVAGGIVLHF